MNHGNILKILLPVFLLISLIIIFTSNLLAKDQDTKFEIIKKPIEFIIYNSIFTSKKSVDNFLSNTHIDTDTLNSLGLIKSENGFQIIEGGKYYQTFYTITNEHLEEATSQLSNVILGIEKKISKLITEDKTYNFPFILFLIVIIFLLTALCLYVVFYFKWKKLDETKLVTFPQKAINVMETFQKEHINFKNQISKHLKETTSQLSNVIQETGKEISKLNEQIKEFKNLTEKRGEELKRYKDGYDYSNLKSLILGLIDNIKYIEKNLSNQEIVSSPLLRYFEAVKDKLDLLLQSRGIEKFIPETGKPITEIVGCRPVDTVITQEKNQVNNIAEVVQPGFKINMDDNNIKIIKEAEVKVYKGEENV